MPPRNSERVEKEKSIFICADKNRGKIGKWTHIVVEKINSRRKSMNIQTESTDLPPTGTKWNFEKLIS